MPMFGRIGISTPSSTKVCWPIFGAVQGVDGAMIASTSLNSSSTRARYQRRNFCAWFTERGRHHGARDQPVAHRRIEIVRARAQTIEMQRRAFGRGDDVGRGARAGGFRDFDLAGDAERLGDALDRGQCLRECALAEIAAGDRNTQAVLAAADERGESARSAGRRTPGRPGRSPAWRRRRARARRPSAQTARHGRGFPRTESCARGSRRP